MRKKLQMLTALLAHRKQKKRDARNLHTVSEANINQMLIASARRMQKIIEKTRIEPIIIFVLSCVHTHTHTHANDYVIELLFTGRVSCASERSIVIQFGDFVPRRHRVGICFIYLHTHTHKNHNQHGACAGDDQRNKKKSRIEQNHLVMQCWVT